MSFQGGCGDRTAVAPQQVQSQPVQTKVKTRPRVVALRVNSWWEWGAIHPTKWEEQICQRIPQKRLELEFAADLFDPNRLGPGHMQTLDALYAKAVKAVGLHPVNCHGKPIKDLKPLLSQSRRRSHSR